MCIYIEGERERERIKTCICVALDRGVHACACGQDVSMIMRYGYDLGFICVCVGHWRADGYG